MGMMVIGCLVATVIPIKCPLTFTLATGVIEIQTILDTILPKFLPFVAFLLTYVAIRKGVKPTIVIAVMFVVAIALSLTGVLL